jgi:hypothetical protein
MRLVLTRFCTIVGLCSAACGDGAQPAPTASPEVDGGVPIQTDAAVTIAADAAEAQPAVAAAHEPGVDTRAALALRGVLDGLTVDGASVLGLAYLGDPGLSFWDATPAFSGVGPFTLEVAKFPDGAAYAAEPSAVAGGARVAFARIALLPPDHPAGVEVGDGLADNDDTPGPYLALSENAVVVWTDRQHARDSVFARLLGLKEDLPAGYSVVALGASRRDALQEGTDPGVCAGDECFEVYADDAYAAFNRLHGTAYDAEEGVPEGPRHDQERDELEALSLELAVQAGIDIARFTDVHVLHPGAARFDVRLVSEPEDLF